MTPRSARTYGERQPLARTFHGINVTTPKTGFYRHRLVSGGVIGGVRIWFGPPSDPVTGEELDRSWRWQAEFDGEYIEFDRAWPQCAGAPITEQEYRTLVARREWALKNAPGSAFADRTRRHDPLSSQTPMPF